jgi:hypothetical protein
VSNTRGYILTEAEVSFWASSHDLPMPPVVLLTGAGAGDNITLPLDINEPTLVVLGAPPLLNEVGGRVVAIVVGEVGPVDKGSEVEESRGGLGSLEMVSHVLSLFVLDLDLEPKGILLPIELLQISDSVVIGMEVGSQSPVVLLVGIVDEGVGVGRLAVEEFDKPWG